MLARVAESLFWLSRNLERSESLARVIDVAFNRGADRSQSEGARTDRLWAAALQLAGSPAEPRHPDERASESDAFARATFSEENRSSLLSCIRIARANALGVRAELTTEVWEAVNAIYLYVESQSAASVLRDGPSTFLRRIRDAAQALGGIIDATVSHDDEWNFLQIGRYLERAIVTTQIIATYDPADDTASGLQRLLEMCCASEPFARSQRLSWDAPEAFGFLFLHRTFPRSVRFCTTEVDRALHRLSGSDYGTFADEAERVTGRLQAMLDFVQLQEIIDEGVLAFADRVSKRLYAVGAGVTASYFPRIPVA